MKKTISMPVTRRHLLAMASAAAFLSKVGPALAADEAPDAFIKRITTETLDIIKADKSLRNGDVAKIIQLVDVK